jgi:hypothetical protein
MAPDMLIDISVLEAADINRLINSHREAEKHCLSVITKNTLVERITQNYNDFMDDVMKHDKDGIVKLAREIVAVSDVHTYLTNTNCFSVSEAEYLLNYKSPLKVVTDEWIHWRHDINNFSDALDNVVLRPETDSNSYELMSDPGQRRFLNVNLTKFLGAIAEKVVIDNHADWITDQAVLNRIAESESSEGRRLIWKVDSYGTVLEPERDLYIKGIGAYGSWMGSVAGHPSFVYAVYVNHKDENGVYGHVFGIGDCGAYTAHLRRSALPAEGVRIEHENGAGFTLKLSVYDSIYKELIKDNGEIVSSHYYTADETTLNESLLQKRTKRFFIPDGSTDDHLQWLTDILAKIRNAPATLPTVQETDTAPPPPDDPVVTEAGRIFGEFLVRHESGKPNSPNKTHYMVKISPDFLFNASTKDMDRLYKSIPIKGLSFSTIKGQKGIYAFAHKDAGRMRHPKKPKTSVLERLEDKNKDVKVQPTTDKSKSKSKGVTTID